MKLRSKLGLVTLLAFALAFTGANSSFAAPRGKATTAQKQARTTATARRAATKPARAKTTKRPARTLIKAVQKAKPKREPKLRTAEQAAALIPAGANVFLPVGHAVPESILSALTARTLEKTSKSSLTGRNPIKVLSLSNFASRKLYATKKVVPNAIFIGDNNRDAIAAGNGGHIPSHLSRVPRLIREGILKVDVALIQVSPPDKNGIVSLGPTAADTLAAISMAKTVIAEVNPNVPRTYGASEIPMSKIHYMVKSNAPIRDAAPTQVTKTDVKIARNITKLIPSKPTLQFGIGGTTDAVAGELAKSGRKDLRIHSEMISDGTMRLVESGAVKGKVTFAFAKGSQKMLSWMNKNRKLVAETSDVVNDPFKLAQIDRLISINTALRVDLNGDINAQFVGNRFYSGIGGQQDFFRGAMASKGGKAILALPSTSTIKGPDGKPMEVSRIVLKLGKDDMVTTSMHDIQYVVTEYGVAHLEGKTMQDRARELIKVAHPKFRPALREELRAVQQGRKADVKKRTAAHFAAKKAKAKAAKEAATAAAAPKAEANNQNAALP